MFNVRAHNISILCPRYSTLLLYYLEEVVLGLLIAGLNYLLPTSSKLMHYLCFPKPCFHPSQQQLPRYIESTWPVTYQIIGANLFWSQPNASCFIRTFFKSLFSANRSFVWWPSTYLVASRNNRYMMYLFCKYIWEKI